MDRGQADDIALGGSKPTKELSDRHAQVLCRLSVLEPCLSLSTPVAIKCVPSLDMVRQKPQSRCEVSMNVTSLRSTVHPPPLYAPVLCFPACPQFPLTAGARTTFEGPPLFCGHLWAIVIRSIRVTRVLRPISWRSSSTGTVFPWISSAIPLRGGSGSRTRQLQLGASRSDGLRAWRTWREPLMLKQNPWGARSRRVRRSAGLY